MVLKRTFVAGMCLAGLISALAVVTGTGGLAGAAPESTPTQTPVPDPVMGALDLEAIAKIDLSTYPIIPEISEHARQIYQEGLARGNDPHAFIKVGDCMTHTPNFLIPLGQGEYTLGEYKSLQQVIDYFGGSEQNPFSRESQASAGGFNAASVLDSMWADPEFCQAGESPLACESRIMRPSIALIMFGTNDVQYLTEEQFDFSLRSVVVATIRDGTLPIVSTFPERPEFPEKSLLFNQIVVQIAQDYDIPLINLWLALEPLPNKGIDAEETTAMSVPADGGVCTFTGPNLEAGFTVRNLLTLQTLDAVLKAVNQ
jgi:hypothetical protein